MARMGTLFSKAQLATVMSSSSQIGSIWPHLGWGCSPNLGVDVDSSWQEDSCKHGQNLQQLLFGEVGNQHWGPTSPLQGMNMGAFT